MEVGANEPIMVGEVGDLLLGHPDYREHLGRLHKNPIYVGIRVSNLWGRNVEELLKKPQVWTDLRLDTTGALMDKLTFWDNIPRRSQYVQLLEEIKAA